MSLWDSLSPIARDSGALAGLEDVLRDVGVTTTNTEEPGTPPRRHITATWSPSAGRPLSFDPARGSFALAPVGGGSTTGTPIEFPDPTVSLDLLLDLDGPGGDPSGPFTAKLTLPSAVLRLPFLRGARLDSTGMLEPDPAHSVVRFILPRLTIEADYTNASTGLRTRLASASTAPPAGSDPADIYDFVRMDPGYALIGPAAVVGFGFRVAALDLSATSNPPGGAHAMPVDWQGLWLPEARLFVAPSGMAGLAVSAGVEDLWIGIGVHAGVTGLFEAEVVNRANSPTLRIRFQDPQGRWYGAPGSATTARLPETSTAYVDGGGGLAPLSYTVRVGATTTSGDRATVTTPAAGSIDVTGTVTDGLGRTVTRTVTCTRRPTATVGSPAGGQEATASTTSTTGSRVVVVSQTASEAIVQLEPAGGTVSWSWPGGGPVAGPTATVPVAGGATVTVTATRTRAATAPVVFDCYWLVDHPRPAEDGLPGAETFAYSLNPDNTSTTPALADGSDFSPGGVPFQGGDVRGLLTGLPAGTTFVVDGFASEDGPQGPTPAYNLALSSRRMNGLKSIIESMLAGASVGIGTAHGAVGSVTARNVNWHATATATPPTPETETVTAVLQRPATPPETPADLDRQPERAPVPACFHKIGVRVELIRGTFVRAEVYGEFDIQTAAEQRLSANSLGPLPPRTNPQDGVCTFLVRLRIDEARSRWDVLAEFRALDADTDGLARITRPAAGGTAGIDALGAVAALAPLLAAATPPSPTAGELVALGVSTAAVAAIGAAGVVRVEAVTLHGGELRVADAPEGTLVAILLDVETKLSFDLVIIRVRADKPLTTRYQAVGLKSSWNAQPGPGGVEYVPIWMFDPSEGYSLDVPTGALVARDPFGDLLRVLGFRVSRDNPTYFEAEVGIGVDLGIVVIDAVRVRVRVGAVETPQITAFGATVDVPGVLHGSGYLSLPAGGGITGFVDLTVNPLALRVAAALKIDTKDGVTGVFVGVEVDFPVPIVLGSSGLGIFGFLGGIGVNFERIEPAGVPAPALRWLEQQMPLPLGVLNPTGWRAAPGKYAFAAGVLLGTLEGGYVVHLKGIVIFELPGPRLLFIMKADVLKPPPALRGSESATFLAVLDLDLGRGTITIGLVAQYEIPILLHVRVPVTAFFSTTDVPAWFVDLGTWQEPVTVKVFETFEGVGYVMVHGRSIAPPPPPLASVATSGLTIAAGLHVQFVWGSTSVGLYLKIAGGFDAIISFQPFAFGGVITISGELRLFIVSIGASAKLTVLSGHGYDSTGALVDRTYIHGEVCGNVDFFFFSVSGCVGLSLGSADVPDPDPEPLIRGVVLVSRSPALLEGSATDRAVDGKLGDARDTSDAATVAPDPVPLDAIPVVLFDVAPDATGLTVFGQTPLNGTGLGATHWMRRGRRWWAYKVDAVELVGPLGAGGAKPSVWWSRGLGDDPKHGPALALLAWLPAATPKAVVYGETLTTTVTEEWGTVCSPPAPPAPVLWTFDDEPAGPSPAGWTLRCTPWPDPPDAYRSSPVRADLRVTERWRCGDEGADGLRGIDPAHVIADAVACPRGDSGPDTALDPFKHWAVGQPTAPSRGAALEGQAGLVALLTSLSEGASLPDSRADVVSTGWDPTIEARQRFCDGAVLQSPYDDGKDPIRRGAVEDEKLVVAAWKRAGFTPGEIVDAVRLTQAAGLLRLRVLLLLTERAANRGMVIRCLDAADGVLAEQPIDGSSIVTNAHPLPAAWVDASGPWADPVERAGRMAAVLRGLRMGDLLSLVEVDVPKGAVTAEIGWSADVAGNDAAPPPFFVVAADGLTAAEVVRADWDATTVDTARDALTTSLTQDPDDHALFVPDGDYTVKVTWRAAYSTESDDPPPSAPADSDYGVAQTQEYAFSAEGNDRVPDRLEPWLVATSPGPKEVGTFCDEPVRIAFNSPAVSKLFAAYGTELRAYVHSASGRHPKAPGQDEAVPFGLAEAATSPAAALIAYGPWETAVREQAEELPCLPELGERVDVTVLTIPYEFEPSTDYLLDVERVAMGSPSTDHGTRVLRVPFTTSRFGNVGELAALFAEAPVEHRLLTDRTQLDALPDNPAGAQLDAAFSAAGFGVPSVPRYPRVVVLWDAGAPAQPVAVVVESSEELWRSRPMPVEVTAPPDADDPTHKWWAARKLPWLLPEPSVAQPAPGEPASAAVTRLLRGPGDTRAVAVLGPGSRGSQLRIDLRHAIDALSGGADTVAAAVRVTLGRPPWEPQPGEED